MSTFAYLGIHDLNDPSAVTCTFILTIYDPCMLHKPTFVLLDVLASCCGRWCCIFLSQPHSSLTAIMGIALQPVSALSPLSLMSYPSRSSVIPDQLADSVLFDAFNSVCTHLCLTGITSLTLHSTQTAETNTEACLTQR